MIGQRSSNLGQRSSICTRISSWSLEVYPSPRYPVQPANNSNCCIVNQKAEHKRIEAAGQEALHLWSNQNVPPGVAMLHYSVTAPLSWPTNSHDPDGSGKAEGPPGRITTPTTFWPQQDWRDWPGLLTGPQSGYCASLKLSYLCESVRSQRALAFGTAWSQGVWLQPGITQIPGSWVDHRPISEIVSSSKQETQYESQDDEEPYL